MLPADYFAIRCLVADVELGGVDPLSSVLLGRESHLMKQWGLPFDDGVTSTVSFHQSGGVFGRNHAFRFFPRRLRGSGGASVLSFEARSLRHDL